MSRPFLIDAHSHICFSAYRDDADAVIERAEAEGVWQLAVGSQLDTSRRAVEYAERYEHIWAIVGLHPIHLVDNHVDWQEVGEEGKEGVAFRSRSETFDPAAYRTLAEHPKVVAIGECGLDRYRMPKGRDSEAVFRVQEQTFRQQIALAQELDLPLMVHVRDAHEETINILEEIFGSLPEAPEIDAMRMSGATARDFRRFRGMIHCYSGTWDQAQRYLALGFNVGFTGVITFTPTAKQLPVAEELRRTVRGIPTDRFHVETDCPYLTPEPHRGERNEPRYVRLVAEEIAELRGMPLEEIARVSTANTLRLFTKLHIPSGGSTEPFS